MVRQDEVAALDAMAEVLYGAVGHKKKPVCKAVDYGKALWLCHMRAV